MFAASWGTVLHRVRWKCYWCLCWALVFPQTPHTKMSFHPPYPSEFTSRPWAVVSLLESPGFGGGLGTLWYWQGVVYRCTQHLHTTSAHNIGCEQPNHKALAVVLFPWNCLFIFSAHPHLPSQGDVYIYFVVLVCVIIRKVKRSHYDRVRKTLIAKRLMAFHRA